MSWCDPSAGQQNHTCRIWVSLLNDRDWGQKEHCKNSQSVTQPESKYCRKKTSLLNPVRTAHSLDCQTVLVQPTDSKTQPLPRGKAIPTGQSSLGLGENTASYRIWCLNRKSVPAAGFNGVHPKGLLLCLCLHKWWKRYFTSLVLVSQVNSIGTFYSCGSALAWGRQGAHPHVHGSMHSGVETTVTKQRPWVGAKLEEQTTILAGPEAETPCPLPARS